jgi:hypothetical protein
MDAGVDDRGGPQDVGSTVPTTLAVRGTAKGWAIDVHLHESQITQPKCEPTKGLAEQGLR